MISIDMISIERREARAARPRIARPLLALVSLALLAPSYAAAEENEEMADLRRMVRGLQEQNRELSRRLGALEGARAAPASLQTRPAEAQKRPTSGPDKSQSRVSRSPAEAQELPTFAAIPSLAIAPPPAAPPLPEPHDTTGLGLEQRVKELEIGWAAQENATQQIIRNSLSKIGPNINSVVALSGVIEATGGRLRDFDTHTVDSLDVSSLELEFDIKLNEWLKGSIVLAHEMGNGTQFTTTGTSSTSPITCAPPRPCPGTTFPISTIGFPQDVERVRLDRAHILIGDLTRFPIAARVALGTLTFGSTTGVARLDTLSLVSPLTTEVFENRQTAAGLEFALPTPPLGPPPAPVVIPPVQPLVIAPLVRTFAGWLGYTPPPQRAVRLVPVTPPVAPPPFYGSFMVYKGNETIAPNRRRIQEYNASLGYQTAGHCGVPYDELRSSLVCPWNIDFHVDYDSSVFDSKFLEVEYSPFEIGRVPGMAASVKARFGPFALIGEVNSALRAARLLDGFGIQRNFTPITWHASIAYQFGWNPWLTEIGAQGNFISVVYSGSKDMAGVIDHLGTRVGTVPQSRLSVTAGEWAMDALKLSLEYSVDWDYPQTVFTTSCTGIVATGVCGGTGNVARSVIGQIQFNF